MTPSKRDIERRLDELGESSSVDKEEMYEEFVKYASHLEKHGGDADSPSEYFGIGDWDEVYVPLPDNWREFYPLEPTPPEVFAVRYCGLGKEVFERRSLPFPTEEEWEKGRKKEKEKKRKVTDRTMNETHESYSTG